MTVLILTFCDDIKLLYGTLMVFDTLRIGFPDADVLVFDNGSIPEALPQIQAAATFAGCQFIPMQRAPFLGFYHWALFEQTEFDSVVLLDPDVIFWDRLEVPPGLFSGRLMPTMHSQGVTALPRIHPSLLCVPSVSALRSALKHTRCNPVNQLYATIDGKEYFWDTLAMAHQIVPGTAFTSAQLDCYDHLFFGSHFTAIEATLPKDSAIERGHMAAKAGEFGAIQGLWREQEKDFAKAVAVLQDGLFKMPQANIVTEHMFTPGVYERRITIPPWTVLTGAQHKTSYRVRLEKGTIAVNTEDGVKVLSAPCEFAALAGMQRVGRVFEDEVVWVDIYDNPDDCADLAVLESRLYVVPECGLANSRTEVQKAKIDYGAFLHQLRLSHEEVNAIVSIDSDLMDMPEGFSVELRDSAIHGKGLFATRSFAPGDIVCPGRLGGKRTPGGRFINHSPNGNITPTKIDDDIFAVAACEIHCGDELLVDYRASMRVNFGLVLQGEMPCLHG